MRQVSTSQWLKMIKNEISLYKTVTDQINILYIRRGEDTCFLKGFQ